MAPVYSIAENASWYYESKKNSIIISNNTSTTVEVFEGKDKILVNGVEKPISAEPVKINNTLMIPIEDISKALNCRVERNIIMDEIRIYTPNSKIYTNKYAIIPESIDQIKIDGILDEKSWNNAAVLDNFLTVYYGEPANLQTKARLTYDDNNLYIGIVYENPKEIKQGEFQGFEILFKTKPHEENYYYIPIIKSNASNKIKEFRSSEELTKGIRVEHENYTVSINEDGEVWIAELSIPFEGLGISGVESGEEWLINIINHRSTVEPMNSWIPLHHAIFWDRTDRTGVFYRITSNILNEGRFGSIFFKDLPTDEETDYTKRDAILLNTENTRIEYVDFLQKALVIENCEFKFSKENTNLSLVNPDMRINTLAISKVSKQGEKQIIIFEHPEMDKAGIYQLRIKATARDEVKYRTVVFDREDMIKAGEIAQSNIELQQRSKTTVKLAEPSEKACKIIEMIPDKTGFRFVGLPTNPELRPDNLYDWNPSEPDVLISKKDGKKYPNPEYPNNGEIVIKNRKGEDVIYPYYEDEKGRRYFIESHIDYNKKHYVLNETKSIALSSPMDAAWILYEFVKKYEGYVPTHDVEWDNYPIAIQSGPPYSYWGGMWDRWFLNDLYWLGRLADAFSEVKKTDAFEQLSKYVGEDVERRVVENMFKPSVDYVISTLYGDYSNNMLHNVFIGLVKIGRALQNSDYIHKALELIEINARAGFLSDGHWYEVTGQYHKNSIDGISSAASLLASWFDPKGYISPRTGKRLSGENVLELFPVLARGKSVNSILCYPDGKVLPIMDTWASDKVTEIKDTGSILMPSSKIGKLVNGEGKNQTQLYLMFQPKYGHVHIDYLNITLYSLG